MAHYVFRCIRDDEEYIDGLYAKNMNAQRRAIDQVLHGKDVDTQWISVTCSLGVISYPDYYENCRIVAIDLDKVDMLPEDMRNNDMLAYASKNYANKSQELLFKRHVPAEAVTMFFDFKDVEKLKNQTMELTKEDEQILQEVVQTAKEYANGEKFPCLIKI